MIRYNPNINEGLNENQVQYRIKNNYINKSSSIKIEPIYKIVLSSFINLFNIINLYVAVLFFLSHSYISLIFVFIVIFNSVIHVIKEMRMRSIIRKLNNDEFATVIRDSKTICINKNEVVLDDILIYKESSNIITDSIILEGSVLVDESCLSGKVPVIKKENDMLYTGSKIISGKCIARADKISNNNYISKIISITKNKNDNSYVKRIIDTMIKYIGILILILSIIIYIHTYSFIETAKYIYKIIPIEFVLLTTLLFIISIIKLKKKNILIKNFKSIESIKDIDTICFDKTGTLTNTNMVIDNIIPLNKKYNYKEILSSIGRYCNKENEIIKTIYKKYNKKTSYEFINEEAFDNYIKITFKGHKYLIGDSNILDSTINLEDYKGYKTVLLKTEKDNIALILLAYEIKEDSKELITDLYKSNINIKVISGDSKDSVINTCKSIGIKKIKAIDMSINITNMNHQIVEEYNVFYNVSPEQKKILINALRGNNHNVVMVGDGINDILGLNASSSSISINNGILESIKVSQYVITDNKIKGVLDILNNSKSVLNSILKIMYLYLFKTIYSFLITITLFILNIYSLKFDIAYILIFLIPSLLIIFSNNKEYNVSIKDIFNKSIIISLITYILTIIIIIFNLDIKYILLLISSVVFVTLLKYKLLNKLLSILLIIIAFSCIIIL